MAQHTLDLGQLDLVSTTSGLRLHLASSVQVSSDQESGTLQLLVEGGEYDTWTTLAADFHVEIELLNLRERISVGQLGLHEQLAQALYKAPLWPQLQLQPSAAETTLQVANSTATLRTYLSHATHGTDSLTRKTHKISQDVPHHDVEPPHGIGRAELRAVRLQMSFSDTSTSKRRRLPEISHDEMVPESSMNVATSADHDSLNMTNSRRAYTTPERAVSSAQSEHLESMVTSWISDGHQLKSGPSRLMRSLKRCSSTSDIEAGSSMHHELDVKNFFNAGLHYAIVTPHSRHLLKTIDVAGRESFKQLAHVWPTIFSPGAMEAISSRAVFLPTVSHALTGVCGTQARSATLRSKFAEMDRRHVAPQGTLTSTVQNRLSCRLWQTMQHDLLNRVPTSRLDAVMRVGSGSASMSLRDVEHHVAQERTHEKHLSQIGVLSRPSTDSSAAASYPEDAQEGHAVDTSPGPKARDTRVLDAEDDLLSICGSVDSLRLEDAGWSTMPSDERAATVSNTWADLDWDGEDLLIT